MLCIRGTSHGGATENARHDTTYEQHGAAFSCPAISCLAFSASPCRPMLWSCVGLSVFACVCPSQAAIVAHIVDDLRLYWNPKHPPQGNIYAVASPQGGLGWTYPPHFLLEVAPEIDTNPTSFYSGRGGGGSLRLQTLVIGSRSPCLSTPHILTWRRPCIYGLPKQILQTKQYIPISENIL